MTGQARPAGDDWPHDFGSYARYLRKKAGLIQLQVSERMKDRGCDCEKDTVSSWERGVRLPGSFKIAVNLGECLTREEKERECLLVYYFVEKYLRDNDEMHFSGSDLEQSGRLKSILQGEPSVSVEFLSNGNYKVTISAIMSVSGAENRK